MPRIFIKMKILRAKRRSAARIISFIVFFALASAVGAEDAGSGNQSSQSEKSALKPKIIEGWGTVFDPADDCIFKAEAGGFIAPAETAKSIVWPWLWARQPAKLTIVIPGSAEAHDMAAELDSTTAPRVLKRVAGNFVIQVKVDGKFQPGGESSQPAHSGYTGAGLIIFADEKNYVTLQRASLQWKGKKPQPYTNFEMRADGELERIGETEDFETKEDKPTWLRLERKGSKILGAMSQDGGKHWVYGEPKELVGDVWEQSNLLGGVIVVSTSLQPFSPVFSELSTQQGAKKNAVEKTGK
jgi:regulation of enolase protein 1 (concanavalin A-like superfamily)